MKVSFTVRAKRSPDSINCALVGILTLLYLRMDVAKNVTPVSDSINGLDRRGWRERRYLRRAPTRSTLLQACRRRSMRRNCAHSRLCPAPTRSTLLLVCRRSMRRNCAHSRLCPAPTRSTLLLVCRRSMLCCGARRHCYTFYPPDSLTDD